MTSLLATALLLFLAPLAMATDTDGDGLSDMFEGMIGTNPDQADTDGDNLDDYEEVYEIGTDPNLTDSDGDATQDDADSEPLLLSSGDHDGVSTVMFNTPDMGNNEAPSGESPQDGFGVLMHNGELIFSSGAGGAKGVGMPFGMSMIYRSQSDYDGALGMNWFWIGFLSFTDNGTTGSMNWINGTTLTFTESGGTWTHDDDGWLGTLEETSPDSGDFTYTLPNGLEFLFTIAGKIDTITDRFGNALAFTHNGSGQLTSATDTRGESHTIAYYSTGRIKSITYSDKRKWTFIYNVNAQLARIEGPTTASFPNGITQEFRYINGSAISSLNDNLTVAIDGRGNHWLHNEYDTSDRVTKQTTNGFAFELDYTNIGSQKTSVTDRAGNDRDWEWDASKLTRTKLTQFSNRDVRTGDPTSWITEWTHDADGYLIEVELPRGNGTEYTLNSVKLPTEIRRKTDVDAANHTSDLVTTIAYDSAKYYGKTSVTDPRGNETEYILNSNGQPTTIEFPDSTHISPSQSISHTLTYNSDGTLASRTDGESKKTSYVYYTKPAAKKGRVNTVEVDDAVGGLNLVTTYDYTDWGDVKEVTDPEGHKTTYTVEAYGNVTKITYPASLGYITEFQHDGNLNVTKKKVKNIDETGTWQSTPKSWWETDNTYTEMDKISTVNEDIDAMNTRETVFLYDENDNLESVEVGSIIVTSYYDERDLLFQRIGNEGTGTAINAVHEYTYDANGNLTDYEDPRSKVTNHEYDLFDRREKTINALDHYVTTSFDEGGNAVERKWYEEAGTTDTLMAHEKRTYDELNRFYKEEAALIDTTTTWKTRTLELDKRGLVTKRTDRRNNATTFLYDGAGRRIKSTDAEGNEVESEIDDNGNVTKITEKETIPGSGTESFVTEFTYDKVNRRTKQTVIDRNLSTNKKITEWKWNSRNVVAETVDPMTWKTTFVHDGLGRVTKETRDMAGSDDIVTEWTIDENSNITQLKDDNLNTTDYAYDALGRLTTKTYDDAETATYAYDDTNNLIDFTDQNGTQVDYAYDDLNRLTDRDATLGTGVGGDDTEDFAYDALNRLTEAKDDDSIVQYTYDSLGRVLTEKQGPNPLGTAGMTVTFTYDDGGNATKIAYPSGFEARRTFDEIGRVTAIDDKSDADVADFDLYGAGSRRKQVSFANGTTSTYTYDGFRRPTDIAHEDSGSTEFAGFEYGWDKNDNPTYEERSHQSDKGDAYDYDQANRLIEVLQDADDPTNVTTYGDKVEYNLDDVLNFSSVVTTPYGQSGSTVNYTSNGMNEYTDIGGTTRTFDDNGNLADDGTYEYTYDWHNHLIKVEDSGTTDVVAEYDYDCVGRGRRIEKVVGSDTTRFVYADQQCLEELDGSDNLLRLFVFGEALDEIVMMEAEDVADVDSDSNTTELKRFYYHQQLIGSVTHITDPDEVVVESYDYGPYGEFVIFDIGSSVVSNSQIGNPFLYTGRRLDEETGLFYYRARHYDAGNGRFLQRDPLEHVDGPNARAYVAGRPTGSIDPSGLEERDPGGAIGELSEEQMNLVLHALVDIEYETADQGGKGDVTRAFPGLSKKYGGSAYGWLKLAIFGNVMGAMSDRLWELAKFIATSGASVSRAIAHLRKQIMNELKNILEAKEAMDEADDDDDLTDEEKAAKKKKQARYIAKSIIRIKTKRREMAEKKAAEEKKEKEKERKEKEKERDKERQY